MADTCSGCQYFRRGYRAGRERGWQWTEQFLENGPPVPTGRCQLRAPTVPNLWPECHEDDWCGQWTAKAVAS